MINFNAGIVYILLECESLDPATQENLRSGQSRNTINNSLKIQL